MCTVTHRGMSHYNLHFTDEDVEVHTGGAQGGTPGQERSWDKDSQIFGSWCPLVSQNFFFLTLPPKQPEKIFSFK